MPIKLVAGLGNPDEEGYARTRHNVGHRVVQQLQHTQQSALQNVVLYKSEGYMNSCGRFILNKVTQRGYSVKDLLIVCDDFAIPLGALRIRRHGSSGGHHGLNSIIESFGTEKIARVRMGIGPVPPDVDPADFVLKPFTHNEEVMLEKCLVNAAEAVRVILTDGIERAMNRFNKKERVP